MGLAEIRSLPQGKGWTDFLRAHEKGVTDQPKTSSSQEFFNI